MRSHTLTGLLVLVLVSFLTVGCCDKENKIIADLQQQCNELSDKNKGLQSDIALAKGREAELLTQIDGKDLDITAKDARITGLEAQVATLKASKPVDGGRAAPGWEKGAYGDKITVGSDILFASGKATLTTAGKTALGKIVRDIKTTYAGRIVRVYGYTDNDPIKVTRNLWTDNLDLSANRAMAVTRHLTKNGIKAETVETVAMGATRFVSSNASKAGKAKNRRVEIIVIRPKP